MIPYPDSQFKNIRYQLSEGEHHYGENVHILSDPFLLSHLAHLCSENTTQPAINQLVTTLYSSLLQVVVNQEFPTKIGKIRTRMASTHPEGVFQGPIIDQDTRVVTVNLARAGTLPSHVCYTALNYFMNPTLVRQDHISIGRTTNELEKVTGSQVSGHKVGGRIDQAVVLFPDPMGATGSTLCEALNLYKSLGNAMKYVAIHCIITPEYIKKIHSHHPDLKIYAIRLDRGLSPKEVLESVPGKKWEQEKGLNEKQYIVPGAGGFGEIMNNAYV
jgi:uracil phosphoribosyltransferase